MRVREFLALQTPLMLTPRVSTAPVVALAFAISDERASRGSLMAMIVAPGGGPVTFHPIESFDFPPAVGVSEGKPSRIVSRLPGPRTSP